MKRFYSHYTFIYPDIYLKNYVVELDFDSCITDIYPYVNEIENTEFHNGVLFYFPHHIPLNTQLLTDLTITNQLFDLSSFSPAIRCCVYSSDGNNLLPFK